MITSKRVHFTIGFFIVLVYGFIYSTHFGFCLATMLSLFKEHEDQQRYGYFDWHNTVITWFGSMAGFLFVSLLNVFLYAAAP